MTTLEEILPAVFGHEGGYGADPDDKGNWTSGRVGRGTLKGTKYGISAASYPKLDIRSLTVTDAIRIYERDFWPAIKAEQLPANLRYSVFDMAVNAGVSNAVKALQRAAKVTADGVIGPKTLAAALNVSPLDFARQRILHNIAVVRNNPKLMKYLNNWTNRTMDVLQASLAI
jgi:lysozyme family protein